jgi:hypothetical protein
MQDGDRQARLDGFCSGVLVGAVATHLGRADLMRRRDSEYGEVAMTTALAASFFAARRWSACAALSPE